MINTALKDAFVASVENGNDFSDLVQKMQKSGNPAALAEQAQMQQGRGGKAGLAEMVVQQSGYSLPELLGYSADNYGTWATLAFVAANQFSQAELLALPVLLARIAFVAPEATFGVMEAISDGWLRGKASPNLAQTNWANLRGLNLTDLQKALNLPPATAPTELASRAAQFQANRKIPAELLELFWQEAENPVGSGNVIEKVTAFGGTFDNELRQAYNQAMLGHPGTAEAYQEGFLRTTLEVQNLKECQPGSLGYTYYHQIVDNGLEFEILKTHQLVQINGVTDYSGRRVLQTHDLWHVVTGYTTDGLDEIALQAFQLAQLGSPFSSNLLAMLMTRAALLNPQMIPYFMQAISEGWQHGRSSCPFLPIRWENFWNSPVEELRHKLQIQPFSGNLMAAV